MKILIVEDEFVCRRLLHKLLSEIGECDIAINGEEAIEAFRLAFEEETPYSLITLDIMMPGVDGNQTLQKISEIQAQQQVDSTLGVKVIITTSLDEAQVGKDILPHSNIAYLLKPVSKEKIEEQLRVLRVI